MHIKTTVRTLTTGQYTGEVLSSNGHGLQPVAFTLPHSDRNQAAREGQAMKRILLNQAARDRGSVSDTVRHFGFW